MSNEKLFFLSMYPLAIWWVYRMFASKKITPYLMHGKAFRTRINPVWSAFIEPIMTLYLGIWLIVSFGFGNAYHAGAVTGIILVNSVIWTLVYLRKHRKPWEFRYFLSNALTVESLLLVILFNILIKWNL